MGVDDPNNRSRKGDLGDFASKKSSARHGMNVVWCNDDLLYWSHFQSRETETELDSGFVLHD
jgi:hypothetical protein